MRICDLESAPTTTTTSTATAVIASATFALGFSVIALGIGALFAEGNRAIDGGQILVVAVGLLDIDCATIPCSDDLLAMRTREFEVSQRLLLLQITSTSHSHHWRSGSSAY